VNSVQFSSVQFVTLLKQNVLRGCIGLLEQVGFKPSPKLSSTYLDSNCRQKRLYNFCLTETRWCVDFLKLTQSSQDTAIISQQVRQQDAYRTNARDAVKTMCDIVACFSKATFPLLIVRLYLLL